MRTLIVLMLVTAAPGTLRAQTSASFKLEEWAINAGGNPLQGSQPASAGFRIRFDSIGQPLALAGMTGAGYSLDAGFVSWYRPPGEVTGVVFNDDTELVWNPERSIGSYAVYRDALSSLPGPFGACYVSGMSIESAIDLAAPLPGTGYFYLVTARNSLGEEGTKGYGSNGSERPTPQPCP